MCYYDFDEKGCVMKKICLVVAALGFFGVELYAAEQKPCGNSNSYIDMLCKRKQSVLSGSSGGQSASGSSGKMPSTPLVPDFEIEPFADDGKKR